MILLPTLFLLASLFFLRTVSDPDVFWHMKTGQWIWEHQALPDKDPFSYTTEGKQSFEEQLILKGYWLSQVIYHLSFSTLDFSGIVALRFLLAALIAWSLALRSRGDTAIKISLVAAASFFLISFYAIERPQFLSFALFSCMLMLLDQIRLEASPQIGLKRFLPKALLVITMLFWANMHTGYLLGVITAIVIVIMEGIKYAHPSLQAAPPSVFRRLVIASALTAAASFINPNGLSSNLITFILMNTGMSVKTGVLLSANTEYLSTLTYFFQYRDYRIFFYWTVVLLAAISFLVRIRKTDITVAALLLGSGYVSFMHIRYIPFFLLVAIPFIISAFSGLRSVRTARISLFALAAATIVALVLPETQNMRRIFSGTWIDINRYPVHAATFVAETNLTGNMFNHYDWGGYLIWRLGPDRKVFIDGRNFNPDTFWNAMLINWAYAKGSGPMPRWKELLAKHDVSYIIFPVIPSSEPMRRPLPLLLALLKDNDWVPVFFRDNTAVFVRNSPEFANIIRRYGIGRDAFKVLYFP